MKKDLVEAILIIDRSGSMSSIKDSTISGINEFIKTQKESDKTVKITLVQFDNEYEVLLDCVEANSVSELTDKTYVPRGMTALYDAIGRTVDSVGKRLASTPEDERPEKILVVIVTDGYENASTDYVSDKIQSMIEHQRNVYNWEFIYMGANQDAILVGSSLGIPVTNSYTFYANDNANTLVYTALSSVSARYYTTGNAAFTDEEREEQEKLGNSSNNTISVTPIVINGITRNTA